MGHSKCAFLKSCCKAAAMVFVSALLACVWAITTRSCGLMLWSILRRIGRTCRLIRLRSTARLLTLVDTTTAYRLVGCVVGSTKKRNKGWYAFTPRRYTVWMSLVFITALIACALCACDYAKCDDRSYYVSAYENRALLSASVSLVDRSVSACTNYTQLLHTLSTVPY